jgi:hypothetical protein
MATTAPMTKFVASKTDVKDKKKPAVKEFGEKYLKGE